ncbi:MAG: hypothetical protein RIS50_1741, partial [Bacteroidota bacterium]
VDRVFVALKEGFGVGGLLEPLHRGLGIRCHSDGHRIATTSLRGLVQTGCAGLEVDDFAHRI